MVFGCAFGCVCMSVFGCVVCVVVWCLFGVCVRVCVRGRV